MLFHTPAMFKYKTNFSEMVKSGKNLPTFDEKTSNYNGT